MNPDRATAVTGKAPVADQVDEVSSRHLHYALGPSWAVLTHRQRLHRGHGALQLPKVTWQEALGTLVVSWAA